MLLHALMMRICASYRARCKHPSDADGVLQHPWRGFDSTPASVRGVQAQKEAVPEEAVEAALLEGAGVKISTQAETAEPQENQQSSHISMELHCFARYHASGLEVAGILLFYCMDDVYQAATACGHQS